MIYFFFHSGNMNLCSIKSQAQPAIPLTGERFCAPVPDNMRLVLPGDWFCHATQIGRNKKTIVCTCPGRLTCKLLIYGVRTGRSR